MEIEQRVCWRQWLGYVVFVLGCSSLLRGAEIHVTLDGRSTDRVFEGVGAVSAGASSRLLIDYPEPQRSQILDYLFKPNYGASLQHLKVELGGDVNSTDGSEPSHMRSAEDHNYQRGYEWWLMEEAHRRNPNIILDVLPWGAPGWIGHGRLYSSDMANYVADFIEGAAKYHQLPITWAGIWNEKEFDAEYVKQLHQVLTTRKLAVKIACCDNYPGQHQWRIAEAIRDDAELARSIDALAVHYPRTEDGALTTTTEAKAIVKPLWSSEDQPNSGSGPILSRDWTVGGRILAKTYNRNYLEGALTKTEIWSPVTSYYDNLAAPNSGLMYANTPWSGYYNVQGAIWATAHTTQFAQPGWYYLRTGSGFLPDAGSYVTLMAPSSGNWSIVLETIDARQAQPVTFHLTGGLTDATIHVWQTSSARTFEHVADVTSQKGTFHFNFEPGSLYSLTTTVGQAKGTAQPSVNKPFPFPYQDNFDGLALQRTPKYLADQNGAFEAASCRERSGQCLEQVIDHEPIPWGPMPNPFTMAGDASWTDYQVGVDFLLEGATEATVIGRIDSADVFQDKSLLWPSSYILRVEKNGAWTLLSAKYKTAAATLASGTLASSLHGWQHASLRFAGEQISAEINGRQVAAVHDKTHRAGMMAIGTTWGTAQFDNLQVGR